MKTVVIDAGHGGSDPGATYRGFQEKTFNLSIALNVQRILSQNYQVSIIMTRTTDTSLSLTARTNIANRNNADFFLSIHNNAAGGSGFETYIYNGPLSPNTQTYQNIIHESTYNAIGNKYNVRDRGKKRANLHVTRETDMSSLLIEVLFVDNDGDLALLRNSNFINDVSRGIAEGVADALNLPRKSQPDPQPSPGDDSLYRVIAGSFRNRENAEQRIEALSQEGIPGFVVPTTISGTQYFRVQTGAFSNEANAKEQVERLKRIGITSAFIIRGEESSPAPDPEPEKPTDGLYRVIAGSFRNRENAEQRVQSLSREGITSFIVQTDISGVTYYRVQTGAFSEQENAQELVDRLKSLGITDAFITREGETQPDPDPGTPSDGLYRVIAGSFRNRENAEKRIELLEREGIAGFIVQAEISGVTYYRVQTGAFSEKENAEEQVERLKAIGIPDAFILQGEDAPPPGDPDPDPEPPADDGYTIQGDTYLTACQMDDYVKTVNPDAPELGRFYVQYGEAYGIRGDVAFAQAIHETDYFRFTGLVDAEQNNYAGIGATGPGNPGAEFSTPEEGVHAHIQHLYAYTSTEPIPSRFEKVDPRFDLVTRGIASSWSGLNGRWAVPGDNYGQLILQIHERNIEHALEEMEEQREQLNDVLEEL
ncbi:N-acetylmuramoyl-L-alanine amidase [Halobacillus dabanensis]|uniref:N-acetylmuramoyl-L-alanine amidase n=1 Tax=Halobacillus dabanensis TaxID=240302 RepID=A0A1I3W791_HALDA|nr:SPOR domain-containing protein [Halobacillus dabanensis]SFK03534.1 N-acetylmuramoyl-L-alanine amidase [Halobacillus dabanensis]